MSRSKLFVNRFVVFGAGKFLYDQEFHVGVNIIRGENGTGKSTVMDLLNYGLGAEITEWTVEQQRCDWVATEVLLNGHVITFKRNVTLTGQEKVFCFDGEMQKALEAIEGWKKFPMRRNSETHSFSQQIFELLNLPRHKTDEDKNLTMHQILRLLYVDQLSSTTKLLKEEQKFDNVTFRRAIGEYLLGIDDLEAYNLRQELIEANKEFEKVNAELNAIYRMFGHDESLINVQTLNNDIAEISKEIENLEQRRLEAKSVTAENASEEVKVRVKELVAAIDNNSRQLASFEAEKNELETEIKETKFFLISLEERKAALSESQLTSAVIGGVSFAYCPSCLEPIEENDTDSCCLCKKAKPSEDKDFAYSQLLNEINFQIKESKKIIEAFESDVLKITAVIPKVRYQLASAKNELREINTSTDDKEAVLIDIASEIGFCRSQILSLEDKREQVEKVDTLKERKANSITRISNIKAKLEEVALLQERRYVEVYSSIESKAKNLLKLDGGYEPSFSAPEEVIFDFAKDKMFVNGRSKFSASSMVVMKNSIRFSIFAHAADDKYARIPNLLLMDNIEDKGMREERSQNFQRQMVNVCDTIQDEYQLIYTTSMIADELEGTAMCVGPYYPKGAHTLDF